MFLVFNGDADDQDICTLADKIAKSDDNSFPLKEKALYANMGDREIVNAIMEVYAGWIYDDSNGSGAPEFLQNLVSGTQVYALATAQMLYGLDYKDSNGVWNPIKPITLEEIQDRGYAEADFMLTPGNPTFFRAVKNGVKIYPAASFSVTNGLNAQIMRDITPFTSTSTTQTPGFDSILHEVLSAYMAWKYATSNLLDSRNELEKGWIIGLGRVKSHYSTKFKRDYPGRIKHRVDTVDNYIS